MKYCISDRGLIILLGLLIALVGIGNFHCNVQIQNRTNLYPALFIFVSILCWRVYLSCKELKGIEDNFQAEYKECCIDAQMIRNEPGIMITVPPLASPTEDREILEQLGISVHYLQTVFMEEVEMAGLNGDKNIYDIEDLNKYDEPGLVRKKGADVKCPIDGKLGAAYVHSIDAQYVGQAKVMLSYTWGYSIKSIIEALVNFCELRGWETKDTYVWICFLCVNQHRMAYARKCGKSVPFENLGSIFENRVENIGHLLPLMTPWIKPIYLARVWCLFELIIASRLMKDGKCEVSTIIPTSQKQEFLSEVVEDNGISLQERLTKFFKVLSNTRVQDADAYDENDKKNIMQLIEDREGGYDNFNAEVNKLVREWAIGILKDEVKDRSKKTNDEDLDIFLRNTGFILSHIGGTSDALEIFKDAESSFDIGSKGAARTKMHMASMMRKLGQYKEAEKAFKEALSIQKTVLKSTDVSTVNTKMNIAIVKNNLGNYGDSIRSFKKVISIQKKNFPKDRLARARTMMNLAIAFNNHCHYEQALKICKEVVDIRSEELKRKNACTARAMMNMAIVLSNLGKYEDALKTYEEVISIQDEVIGRNHTNTACTLMNKGNVLKQMGKYDEALKVLNEAKFIQESLLGIEHVDTAATIMNIGSVMFAKGKKKESLRNFNKGLGVFDSVLGKEHPFTARAQRQVRSFGTGTTLLEHETSFNTISTRG